MSGRPAVAAPSDRVDVRAVGRRAGVANIAAENLIAGSGTGSRRYRMRGHSRFVASMKIALPALALLVIILIAVWPQLQASDNRFRVGFAAIQARESDNPSMMNARYVGTDEKDQPFSITADMARNVLQADRPVELEMPKADLGLKDGTWVALTAETGFYARDERTLDLEGEVNLFHDSGYEIRTARAHVDLAAGTAAGDAPVAGHGPFGELASEGFSLDKDGRVIDFTGQSRLIIYPEAGGHE